ncbi:hypothetical protein [Rubripirellula tenax]|uniref:hypothetical protein n=1 Tax=Rubripirellula tenax TaxID=2528015 RepID=UPI0011B649C1|nr:hypothetical protein [Rubripirellula tenax]
MKSPNTLHRRACCRIGATAFTLFLAGCSPSPPQVADVPIDSVRPASFASQSPRDLLGMTLSRYRAVASYRDSGRVKMSYEVGNSTETRAAPMRIWFDRNELYLETYDVRLTSDPESVTAWIADPSSENFDAQVLKSAAIAGRPDVSQLLEDPILAGRITNGLAGPPPQLEWLFSPEPMKSLFQAEHRFDFGKTDIVDGRTCRSVVVAAGDQTFQFWIDERASLVRRVDLPDVVAPLRPGAAPQPIRLSIDLVGATVNPPDRAPTIEPLPESPKWVRRFVPLPPSRPARILGTKPSSFRVTDSENRITFTDWGSDRPITIWVRMSSDPLTMVAVATAQNWSDRLPNELRDKLRFAILVDTDAASFVPDQVTVPVIVDGDGKVSAAIELDPGAASIMDDRGMIAWIDPMFSEATLSTFGAALSDVIGGVDVPGRLRQQWTEQVAVYDRTCREVAVKR